MKTPKPSTLQLLLLAVGACSSSAGSPVDAGNDASSEPCALLFGRPNERTGLDESQCRPTCSCGAQVFTPRSWDQGSLDRLSSYEQTNPPAALAVDPYLTPPTVDDPVVCAVIFDGDRLYRTETFASEVRAHAAGGLVTHAGACGLCSSLADLRVYAEQSDLTAPVRACGVSNLGNFSGLITCLEGLGFTPPCASIWAYNVEHTRTACGAVCARLLTAPYHTPDGTLNACLSCDEEQSGAVFKSVAGRTRRNSGLANAMCRPCAEVVPLEHAYPGL